jgi:hypothetical protein
VTSFTDKTSKKVIGVAKIHQLINPIELPYFKHSKLPARRKNKNAESLSCVLKRFKNCCCAGLALLICLALHLYSQKNGKQQPSVHACNHAID